MNDRTRDQESRNVTTRKSDKGKSKQDRDQAGGDLRMSKNGKASPNSKGQRKTPSRSKSLNGSKFETTPSEMEEKESSSSSSTNMASVSPFPKVSQEDWRAKDPEMEREGTVTISFATFGRNRQAEQTAIQMVKDLQVRQHNIIHAAYNGKELELNKKWADPVITSEPTEPMAD